MVRSCGGGPPQRRKGWVLGEDQKPPGLRDNEVTWWATEVVFLHRLPKGMGGYPRGSDPHDTISQCSPTVPISCDFPSGTYRCVLQLGFFDPPSLESLPVPLEALRFCLCFRAQPSGDPHLLPPLFRSLLIHLFSSQDKSEHLLWLA